MKIGPGLPLAGGALGGRTNTGKALVKPVENPFDHVDNTTQFHTANLNSNSSANELFQQIPDVYLTPFDQEPPVNTNTNSSSMSSNFDSADSDELANMFGGPPPAPKRDESTRMISPDPFSSTMAPPPPAAPFLGYNQSPYANSSPMFSQPNYTSPSLQHRQASPMNSSLSSPPQRQPTQILPPARSVNELFDAFMSQIAPENQPAYLIPEKCFKGLQHLYDQQRWKTLESTAEAVANSSTNPEETLQAKSWQLVALFKQRQIFGFEKLLESIGNLDSAKYSWESYPQYGQTGSFVPLRLHFLAMQLPRLKNNYQDYETASSAFIAQLDSPNSPDDAPAWAGMATIAMINTYLERKKLHLALRMTLQYVAKNENIFTPWELVIWLSRVGRIHLQMGNLVGAEQVFMRASSIPFDAEYDWTARLHLNQGLLYFAQNKFKEALDTFNTILQLYCTPEPVMYASDPFLSIDDGDVVSCAANNLAICALYSCEVHTAVTVLESVLQGDPVRHLHSAIVFNLSTLYDLVCDNANATNRKEMIKRVAEAYAIEHIDSSSFRI
ncbi:hypothetical protein THRCLA_02269 [Thraustotheca clavata]|uniref:Uncharacterized protein n=1 Tax=Thraustotheca clavata TaxID=74557 RepID=A0A1W0A5R9_9STRA|nr:hypothetical protein THRCLA_02269 [Thraustotheca clavata]